MHCIMAGMDQKDSYVARLWQTWCQWFRLQTTVDFPQLQSIKVVDISFVVQRLFSLVFVTVETHQLRVDTVVDAPGFQVTQIPMVQIALRTIVVPQLLPGHGGQCPCQAGLQVVKIPVVAQRQFPMVFQTIDTTQLLDTVIDVLVLQVVQVVVFLVVVQLFRRNKEIPQFIDFVLGKFVHTPVVCNDSCYGSD